MLANSTVHDSRMIVYQKKECFSEQLLTVSIFLRFVSLRKHVLKDTHLRHNLRLSNSPFVREFRY